MTLFKQNMISHHSMNSKVLDSCRDLLWRAEGQTLSSVEKKVTELLTAKDLAASCITSFKQNIISHQSRIFKSD
jgi:hypothetical protein